MSEPLSQTEARRLKREIKRLTYELRVASNQVPMLRAMVEGSPDALAILNHKGNVVEHNSRLVELRGAPGMLHGQAVQAFFHQMAVESCNQKNWSLLPDHVLVQARTKPMRMHGFCNDVPVEVDLSPVQADEEAYIIMAVRVLDETSSQARELHKARVRANELGAELRDQREVQRAARLESLAMLSGTLAHDLNNALAVVSGNLEILREEIDNKAHQEHLDDIAVGSRAVSALANRLRMFSKGPSPLLTPLDLSSWLGTFLAPLAKTLKVEVVLRVPDEPCWVAADEGQLGQVMLNLLSNASQASDGARVIVRVSLSFTDQSQLGVVVGETAEVSDTGYFLLQVHDEGPGIPDNILPTIFEPFFTTKVKGSGLGLASVAGIVRAHQGGVGATNADSGGALFSVTLPRCPPHRLYRHAPAIAARSELPLADCCILLLDDQPHVRQVFRRHLTAAGARVHSVATGEEALEEYRHLRSSGANPVCVFDLLVDGGMGGIETLAELSRQWPDVIAIACSGHAEVDMANSYGSFGFRDYLSKPFSGASLIQAVLEQHKEQ